MKPMKISVEQNDGKDVLWKSTSDRWCRNAKHRLKLSEKQETDFFEQGDMVLFEDRVVEVKIPKGPNFTVGIILDGKLTMVRENKINKLDEQVMSSGVSSISPINRILQLSGLSAGHTLEGSDTNSVISENDASGAYQGLLMQNMNGDYRNNPTAARLATIGEIVLSLESEIDKIHNDIDQDTANKLHVLTGLGAYLLTSARKMTKL